MTNKNLIALQLSLYEHLNLKQIGCNFNSISFEFSSRAGHFSGQAKTS